MPLAFLAPAFLAGLAMLAVPLIIHLTHRQRKEVTEFPSLMFLRQIPYRTVRRQRIRHWVLFALRCLAIILLALAFARPLFQRGGLAGAASTSSGAREIVILLDRSYSMGYGDRWTRAVSSARRVLNGMRTSDRATIVLFASTAEAIGRPTSDRAALNAMLGGARLSSGATRYAPAIGLASTILGETDLPRREVVLITDFQRSGWTGDSDARLPAGTTVAPVDVSDENPSDVAVANVAVQRSVVASRERVTATARLTNISEQPETRTVGVALNGRVLETKQVSIPAKGAAAVSFAAFALPEGSSRVVVSAQADALPANDSAFVSVTPGEAVNVLVVEDVAASANASLYLRRALELGDDPAFRVDIAKGNRLGPADLRGRDVVILNDVNPGTPAAMALRAFVLKGGGLLMTLGERATRGAWSSEARELLPAAIGSVADRMESGSARLAAIEYSHPVFEPFRAPRSGDWTSGRFFRYAATTAGDSAVIMARFDDGAIALAERTIGAGTVALWTSTFDGVWNDLPVQPVFLPFVHQLAKHLAGYAPLKQSWKVGEVVNLAQKTSAAESGADSTGAAPASATAAATTASAAGARNTEPALVARTPSGAAVRFESGASDRYVALTEHGFYEIRTVVSAEQPERVIAVNLDQAESDMTRIDPGVLVRAIASRVSANSSAADTVTLTAAARERRQGVWWYLLVAALLALAAETVLSNRLSRRGAVG
ncbi:MAG: BatA domain-containing protein [Gemmatimonadaceae bacterium]|nr:BatA domain-containing protein [Gemmatimonadaceae bacterium]